MKAINTLMEEGTKQVKENKIYIKTNEIERSG